MNASMLISNIEKVEKYLKNIDKNFEYAYDCKSCKESCPDIFNNGYKTTLKTLKEVKDYLSKEEKEILKSHDFSTSKKHERILDDKKFFRLVDTVDTEDMESDKEEINWKETVNEYEQKVRQLDTDNDEPKMCEKYKNY